MKVQGLTQGAAREARRLRGLGREGRTAPQAVTRDDVGERMADERASHPPSRARFKSSSRTARPSSAPPSGRSTRSTSQDYDLDTVAEITRAPKDLIERLAEDIATIKPVAIHQGEGINHWFHATEMNRAAYLPLMLTGNIGKPGAGCHTWAGNYKAALFQGSPWTGPGFKGWVAEDPFELDLDPNAPGKDVHAHAYTKDEEPAYWNHGDKALIVDTPKHGRKNFTGETHMPTPTKAIIFTNVNLINNAKWAYEMIKNVNPNVEMIVSIDIQMTASIEYADLALPANSWLEFEGLEVTGELLEPVPPDLEGRHPAGLRQQGRPHDPGRHRQGAGRGHRRPALRRHVPVRARGQARRLPPAPARHLAPRPRATSSPTSWPASTARRAGR